MGGFSMEMRGEVAVITLSNPPYNTLHSDILDEGAQLFYALAQKPPKHGIVLTGDGADFTRGMDTKIAAKLSGKDAQRAVSSINQYCASLHRIPCAIICALNGHTIGAGGIMVLCSDWVVSASGEHRIGLPEAKAGLVFPSVPQAVLDHTLDPVWRRRLSLTSRLLGPEEALTAGLVDEIVEPDKLLDTAITRAEEMMAQPGFIDCKAQLRAKANTEIDALLQE